ncbi:Ff.00g096090.m01.CDS01 [Fusarium sp. VM40]|nr:Ff.00g096090.m01.CDS01 [Fusarium sp. VM40]
MTIITRTLPSDIKALEPHDLADSLGHCMAESFSFMTNLRSLRLELGWFMESQTQNFSEQLSSRYFWLPNLRSLIVSPPSILGDILKHCDNEVLKTLDLKGCLRSADFEEAKNIKNLDRLHLTFLKPKYRSSTWAWACRRTPLLKTLREPQFSGLKWLTVHWKQRYETTSDLSALLASKTQIMRDVKTVAQALPHLERLVIIFQTPCRLESAVCHSGNPDITGSLSMEFVRNVTNLKEFWIVSCCFVRKAYSGPDGEVVSSIERIINMDPEDPVIPWSRYRE